MTEKSVRKKRNIAFIITAAVLAASAAVLGIGAAFGWFFDEKKTEGGTSLDPFAVSLSVRFVQDAGAADAVPENGNLFAVNLINENAANYIGRLRIDVTYTGNVDAMLRVHAFHFWEQGGTNPGGRANALFLTGADFFTNNADSCFYYCRSADYATGGRGAYILDGTKSGGKLNVITGFNPSVPYENDLTLSLMIQAELVQANRAEALWGALPAPPTTEKP